ncbi:MAG: AMP-binding protein [Gammaproteobacteria bacterium]
MTDLETIERDRAALRERWYREGIYGSRSIGDALLEGARRWPDLWCVFHTEARERRVTLREMVDDGLAAAGALRSLGIGPGDVVAVQLPTWYETAVLSQAVYQCGATLLPIIAIYGLHELEFVLRQSRARMLIVPDEWRRTDYAARIETLAKLPDLEHFVVVGYRAPARAMTLSALLERARRDFDRPRVAADDVSTLLYTSGTTSDPKGVQHTHNTLLAEWASHYADPAGVFFSVWPAGHIGGLYNLLRPIMRGVSHVFIDQWVPEVAAQLLQKYRVEESGGTPTFLISLLEAVDRGGYDLSSLKRFNLGGAGVTPATMALTDARGFPGARGYGSTEHPTVSFPVPGMTFEQRTTTDGRILGNEVRIVDDAGNDLPAGTAGEILTRGPELFIGYTDPRLNEEQFLPGGWFRTGDIGRVDADGFLAITDRKKDIIIRGGENISSKEVEDLLARHPAVQESAVTGMPDERLGERVCAFVALRPGASLTIEDVRAHFAALGVARQKTPERIEIVTDFPRTAAGKVRKIDLRQKLREQAGRGG